MTIAKNHEAGLMLGASRLPLAAGVGIAAVAAIAFLAPGNRQSASEPAATPPATPAACRTAADAANAVAGNSNFQVQNVRYTSSLRTTLYVEAPLDFTFAFLEDLDNFSRCLPDVHEIRDLGGSRSRWLVGGPAGIVTYWDVHIVRSVPNQILTWKNGRTSLAAHEGRLRFYPVAGRGTYIEMTVLYSPPAGSWGTAAAEIFGADLKADLQAILLHLKFSIEMEHRFNLVSRGRTTG